MMEGKKVLVITAHPDDAEFGAAGTVAQWVEEGAEVFYVICTNGDKGSDDPEMTSEKLAAIREEEQRCAAHLLGVKDVVFLGHPDGTLEDTPEFRKELVREIRRFRPEVVVTSDPSRHRNFIWHRDHRIAGTVALDAIFPYARDRLHYPELLAEGFQPHKVREVYLWASEEPDTFIDISATFHKKMAALACHASQLSPEWRDNMEEMLRERARLLGEKHGIPLAEAFRRLEIRR